MDKFFFVFFTKLFWFVVGSNITYYSQVIKKRSEKDFCFSTKFLFAHFDIQFLTQKEDSAERLNT